MHQVASESACVQRADMGLCAGDYVEGLRSGNGIMLLPDGGTYTGEFAGDKFEGTGTYEYPDGSCYVGTWLAGKKHGAGVQLLVLDTDEIAGSGAGAATGCQRDMRCGLYSCGLLEVG